MFNEVEWNVVETVNSNSSNKQQQEVNGTGERTLATPQQHLLE